VTNTRAKVFITGASSGIGFALAQHYAARGWVLGLAARRGDAAAALLRECGATGVAYRLDVGDRAAVQDAADAFVAAHGAPNVVIANAGISHGTDPFRAEDFAAFEAILRTNVLGVVATCEAFLPAMRQAGGGTLAGIASVAGFRGLPGASGYSSSKAAAITYLESLRLDCRRVGIKVVTICPGFIRTAMTAANPYSMPFVLEAGDAARRIARVIDSGRSFAVVPWQMAAVGSVLRLLPNAIYDRLASNAPRKPRHFH
jgi:short-subunit dehydrogenase